MTFAVIQTGGKQYTVTKGQTIGIEKLAGEVKVGDTVTFDQVLLVEKDGVTTVGTPTVAKATVKGVIKEIGRGAKVEVVKYKQKSRYYKKNGHRQPFMRVEIANIA
jgi:large subunit ribosomal protein L21